MVTTLSRAARTCISIVALAACGNGAGVRYPGNGFPDLSPNRPITELNHALRARLSAAPGFRSSGQTLLFIDAPAVRYVYPEPLVSPRFAMSVPVQVTTGECRISLGSTVLVLRPNAASVLQGGKPSQDFAISVSQIDVFAFPYRSSPNSSARLQGAAGQPEFADIAIPVPAIIAVECTDHSSGEFGPWSWIRGLE